MKAKSVISFIILFALLPISGEALSQLRRMGITLPQGQYADTLRTDSLQPEDGSPTDSLQPNALKKRMRKRTQRGDSLQADSLRLAAPMPIDSLAADSLAADTLEAPAKKSDALDAPVDYEATDSIVFTQDGYAHLYGEGKVLYKQKRPIQLEADVITMNIDSSTVFAHGVEDTLGVVNGEPVFTDGDTPYESKTIRYNFKSKKGLISNVVTQQGEGYVVGNNAKKGPDDDIYMKDGKYTTCENHEHPHFYMQMTYAKVHPKKNVVTGPAYLVVEDVPLPLAVPFFFFPFSSSYSSGFIMPTYIDDSNRGFGLSDGGYYFAISDMMDLKLRGDIFTKGSWALNAETNYVKRYKFSGLFQASYQVTKTGDKGLPDYSVAKDFKIVWSHRQDAKANPNTTFSASVNFATSSYERTNLSNLYNAQAMTQNTKTSSISYSRSFPDIGLTISGTTNIAQTMKDSSISMTLPDLNISLSTLYPFKRKKRVGDERWYEKISLRYTGRLSNSITTKDNLLFKSNLIKDWTNGMKHEIPISATFTLLKYFNVTPSFSYTERWYTNKILKDWDEETGQVVNTDTIYGFHRVYNYSGSLGINTKIYGMYKPLFFPKKQIQIRHIITPTISFSGSPDFGKPRYGYYKTYYKPNSDGTSEAVTYSPYSGALYGVPSQGSSGSVSFQISNNLEMKYKDKNDSIHKVSLIDELGASISYNLAATTRPWSNLSTNLRLKLTKNYTFSMSSTFATYAYAFDSNGNVITSDRTEWSYGRFGRFQGYSSSFSYTLNNDTWSKLKKLFTREKEEYDENINLGEGEGEGEGEEGEGEEEARRRAPRNGPNKKQPKEKATVDADGYQVFNIPWSLNLNYNFNISENTSATINKKTMRYPYKFTQNLSASGNVRLTDKWAINFSTGYDFSAHKIVQTSFNITRDLHCFSMSASISPFGTYKYYTFKINANASILQDLKWDKRSQTQSNIQWY